MPTKVEDKKKKPEEKKPSKESARVVIPVNGNGTKPQPQKKTTKESLPVKIGPKKLSRIRAGLTEALKDAKEGALTLKGMRAIIEAGEATAFGKKGMQLAERLAKAQAEAEEPKSQLSDLIIDLQQDIGELASKLGMGGAGDDDGAAVPGEEEDEQGTPGDMGDMDNGAPDASAGDLMAEDEDEEESKGKTDEAEDEEESEGKTDEGEITAGESEDEEESEGKTDEAEDEEESEGKTDESEDEEESEGRTDEDAGGAAGMGDGAKPMRMAFKCAHCGEGNTVAPPKGYSLAKMGEADKTKRAQAREDQALVSTVDRLKRVLEAKEGRFVATNKRVARILQENIALRAENQGMKRVGQAKKFCREAGIPQSFVPNLLAYEPHQWKLQGQIIKQMMEAAAARESDVLNGGKPGSGGGNVDGKGKPQDGAAVAISHFTESYQRNASR